MYGAKDSKKLGKGKELSDAQKFRQALCKTEEAQKLTSENSQEIRPKKRVPILRDFGKKCEKSRRSAQGCPLESGGGRCHKGSNFRVQGEWAEKTETRVRGGFEKRRGKHEGVSEGKTNKKREIDSLIVKLLKALNIKK